MTLEGTVKNGALVPDSGLRLPEGTRLRYEIIEDPEDFDELDRMPCPDASLPDDHPHAPYNREKELAILRESIASMNAGEVGLPLDEAMAMIAKELNLPSANRG
jgi:hypothetical protein